MRRTAADRKHAYFPAFLDLVGKRVIVVGGGEVAASKVRGLLECGADLVVIAPAVCSTIGQAAAAGRLVWHARPYAAGDVVNATLTFAATDDRSVNAQVAVDARQSGSLVLAVDDVPYCDFIAPALVRRGNLVIAISTNARSPAVARRVREWLDAQLPAYWGTLLEAASGARQRLGARRSGIAPDDWQRALARVERRLADSVAADQPAPQLEADLLEELQARDWSMCTDGDDRILDTLNNAVR